MFEINKQASKELQVAAAKFNLKFVVLFGSHLENRANMESDLDMAIFLNNFSSFNSQFLGNVFTLFSDIFRGYNLDISILNSVDPLFRREIVRKGQLVYGNELEYLEFKAFAFRDYIDTKDLRDIEGRLVKKRQSYLKELIR